MARMPYIPLGRQVRSWGTMWRFCIAPNTTGCPILQDTAFLGQCGARPPWLWSLVQRAGNSGRVLAIFSCRPCWPWFLCVGPLHLSPHRKTCKRSGRPVVAARQTISSIGRLRPLWARRLHQRFQQFNTSSPGASCLGQYRPTAGTRWQRYGLQRRAAVFQRIVWQKAQENKVPHFSGIAKHVVIAAYPCGRKLWSPNGNMAFPLPALGALRTHVPPAIAAQLVARTW